MADLDFISSFLFYALSFTTIRMQDIGNYIVYFKNKVMSILFKVRLMISLNSYMNKFPLPFMKVNSECFCLLGECRESGALDPGKSSHEECGISVPLPPLTTCMVWGKSVNLSRPTTPEL